MDQPAKQRYRVRLELPDGKGVLTEPVCALCGEGGGSSILCPLCHRLFCSDPCFGVHLKAVDDERDLAPLPEPPADLLADLRASAPSCPAEATPIAVPSLATLRPLSAATTPALLLHRLAYVSELRETHPLATGLADITRGSLPPLQHGVRQLDRKAFATWSIQRLRRLPKAERDARIVAWFKLLVADMPEDILQKVYATAGGTTLAGTITAFQKAPEHWYTVLAGLGIDPDCGVCGAATESVEMAVCEACGWEDVRRCPRCARQCDAVYQLPLGQKTLKLHRVVCKGKMA